jgi:hypothetical protein
MKRLSIFVFIISFVFAQSVLAETEIGTTPSVPTSSSSSGSGGSGTNKTAKSSSAFAQVAQMASATAGGMFMAKCTPQTAMYCALGAANLAAAMLMGKGASNAKDVGTSTQAIGGSGSTGSIPAAGFSDDGGTGGFADLSDLSEQVSRAGYSVSADGSTMTLPDGRTVSTAALASGSVPGYAMTDEIKDQMAAIEAEAIKKASGNKVVAIGLQDGGGGGGGATGAEESSSRFNMADYLKSLKNRDPSSVSGLSKKLGEDNIGIKSDNIFDMVSRQYKRKQSQSAFMN